MIDGREDSDFFSSKDPYSERLLERRERWGYSYTVVPGDKASDFAPIVAKLTGA